jgi:transcription termination factor Rho
MSWAKHEHTSHATAPGSRPLRVNITELESKSVEELRDMARELDLSGFSTLKREDLIFRLLQNHGEYQNTIFSAGLLENVEEGFGFLRQERFLPGNIDVYVSQSQIRRFGLRPGDIVSGQVRPPKENEKYYGLLRVEAVNGMDPEIAKKRPHFEALTPIFPNKVFNLETGPGNLTGRLINMVAPLGRGQRALIVAPPKAGKTILLKNMANAIATNHPDVHLIIALIAERPEEVTDMRRSVKAEVVSATFDEASETHTRVAEMVLERAKRLVEAGRDVVVLLDSLTRLGRAYNLIVPNTGRTLSGGLDPVALYPPKRFFGAARNLEEGGSLTIVSTVLIDTNSRLDDAIYEEFKGTGNSEITLDRKLSERRVFPAIDISRTSTRRDDLLLDERSLRAVITMRRMFAQLAEQRGLDAMEAVINMLSKTKNNEEFLTNLNKSIS